MRQKRVCRRKRVFAASPRCRRGNKKNRKPNRTAECGSVEENVQGVRRRPDQTKAFCRSVSEKGFERRTAPARQCASRLLQFSFIAQFDSRRRAGQGKDSWRNGFALCQRRGKLHAVGRKGNPAG